MFSTRQNRVASLSNGLKAPKKAFSQAVSPNGRPPWAMQPGDLVDFEVMDFKLSRTGKKGDNFAMKKGGFTLKHGDFSIKICDFTVKDGVN